MNGAKRLALGALVFGIMGACLVLARDDDPEKKGDEKKARAGAAYPEALFKRFDTNKDGKISLDEFAKIAEMRERLAAKGGSPEARAKMMEKLKEKGIDPESFKQKLKEKGIDPDALKEKLKEKQGAKGEIKPVDLFKKLDKNQDNYLDPEEFRSMRGAFGTQPGRAPEKK